MKKLYFVLFLLVFAGESNAQVFFMARAGYATPGSALTKYKYPSAGWTAGLSFQRGIIDTKSFQWMGGFNFDFVGCGDKTYNLKDGKEEIFNTAYQLNLTSRMVYNQFKLKPFIEYSYGALFTGFDDNFTQDIYSNSSASSSSTNNSNNNPVNNPANKTATWNQCFTTGLMFPINDQLNLEISSSYAVGGPTSFVDFSTVYQDQNYVYMNSASKAPRFEMFSFRIGLQASIDWNSTSNTINYSSSNVGGSTYYHSSSSSSSSTRSSSGGSHFRTR